MNFLISPNFFLKKNKKKIKKKMSFNNHIFTKNKENNKIYCWGKNNAGQLGLGDN